MLIVPAFAKLTLTLSVLDRRPDGFHSLDAVLVTVDWHDLVGVALTDPGRASLRVTGDRALDAGPDHANLALRAAQLLVARYPAIGLSVWLDKRLPAGAGMGGGSSDAAAVLAAGERTLRAVGMNPSLSAIRAMAEAVGSDVPAALVGGAVRIGGRGELVSPLSAGTMHLAVAFCQPCATAATFAALSPTALSDDDRCSRVVAALEAGMPPSAGDLGSSLEAAARSAHPSLGPTIDRLRDAVSDARWLLTGSGGAVFALATSQGQAQTWADAARRIGLPARAVRTVMSRLTRPSSPPRC